VPIAFIGTGNMGLPMLINLLKKGFSATAYDIVPAALDRAVALGATRVASPAEAAASLPRAVKRRSAGVEMTGRDSHCEKRRDDAISRRPTPT